MEASISANTIKTKGISALNDAISQDGEAFISVRGKNKFVVLTLEKYNYLRECELDVALLESKQDIANGDFNSYSVEEHMEKIKND